MYAEGNFVPGKSIVLLTDNMPSRLMQYRFWMWKRKRVWNNWYWCYYGSAPDY